MRGEIAGAVDRGCWVTPVNTAAVYTKEFQLALHWGVTGSAMRIA